MISILDLDGSSHPGQSNKRPGPPARSTEPPRKRASYAPRACDACRRRKGRCSGGNPCSYCFARSLHCGGAVNDVGPSYSYETLNAPLGASQESSSLRLLTPAPSTSSRVSRPVSGGQVHHDATLKGSQRSGVPVEKLIADLQEQIGTLTSRLRLVENKSGNGADGTLFATAISCSGQSVHGNSSSQVQHCFAPKTVHRKRFCGPTSPDYSLNVAQIRLHQGDFGARLGDRRPSLPSVDENQSDEEESLNGDNETTSAMVSGRSLERLTGFRRLLSKEDAASLIQTYREVFHSFHPIVDLSNIARQLEAWYDQPPDGLGSVLDRAGHEKVPSGKTFPSTEEFTLLSINLLLAIALCAEPSSDVDIGKAIYAYCKEAVHRTTICPAPDLNNAVVALLVGTYHFFRDQLRFAWRMCGLAGVILLELGLHSRDFPEHLLGPDCDRDQIVAVICTTIVLDRQWSAATGLPTHFQESHFKGAMKPSVDSPYLKAMVSFMAVSDKFTSAMSERASGREPAEEDDSFDVLNFQIDQWRRNSLGRYNMATGKPSVLPSIDGIPSWAVLLNLRANAAHSMLLRPFFFSARSTEGSRKSLEPALRFFSDSIKILSNLDKTTQVYRLQLPFYVHLLASACALMSLVVVHVAQNRSSLGPQLPRGFRDNVCQAFREAVDIASRYASVSRASQKLLKRMTPIGNLLSQMSADSRKTPKSSQRSCPHTSNLLHGRRQSSATSSTTSGMRKLPDTMQAAMDRGEVLAIQLAESRQFIESSNTNHEEPNGHSHLYYSDDQFLMHEIPSLVMNNFPRNTSELSPGSPDSSTVFDQGSTSLGEWPLVGGNAFFSEGELLFDE